MLVEVQSFHSPCGRAGNFSLLVQRKVTKRKHTPSSAPSGHPALQVRERVPGVAERTSMCAQRPRAHPARAPSGFSSTRSPRHRGPIWAASCRRSSRSQFLLLRQVCRETNDRIDAVQGCTDSWINRRRSRCRASQGAAENVRRGARRMRARRLRAQGCALRRPRRTREAQGSPIRTMRIGPPRPVPSLFGYFLGTAPQERREQRSWPRSGGGQDARSHAKK